MTEIELRSLAKAETLVVTADGLNFTVFFLQFVLGTMNPLTELIMLPFAAGGMATLAVLAIIKAAHDRARTWGTIFRALLYTVSALALIVAVVGYFTLTALFYFKTPLIFTIHFAVHSAYNFYNAIKACVKRDPDLAFFHLFLGIACAVGSVTVYSVLILLEPAMAIMGVLAGIIVTGATIHQGCKEYKKWQETQRVPAQEEEKLKKEAETKPLLQEIPRSSSDTSPSPTPEDEEKNNDSKPLTLRNIIPEPPDKITRTRSAPPIKLPQNEEKLETPPRIPSPRSDPGPVINKKISSHKDFATQSDSKDGSPNHDDSQGSPKVDKADSNENLQTLATDEPKEFLEKEKIPLPIDSSDDELIITDENKPVTPPGTTQKSEHQTTNENKRNPQESSILSTRLTIQHLRTDEQTNQTTDDGHKFHKIPKKLTMEDLRDLDTKLTSPSRDRDIEVHSQSSGGSSSSPPPTPPPTLQT